MTLHIELLLLRELAGVDDGRDVGISIAEHRFFSPNLGAPALNEMFFDTTEYYQNIDKGRPSYQRKAKKWARIQPLLDRFVPRKE